MSQQDSNAAEPIKAALATMDENLLAELVEAAQFALNHVDAVERVSEEIGVSVERLEVMAGIFISLSVAGQPDHSSIDIARTTVELDAEAAKLADLKADFEKIELGKGENAMSDTVEMPRSEVETIAKILGDNSAAACALKDADVRVAKGENPAFYRVGDTLLVGPRLSEQPE